MTFKEYYEKLTKIYMENPQAHGFPIYSSSDDDGNCYNKVFWTGSLGELDSCGDIYFGEVSPNVVVIN